MIDWSYRVYVSVTIAVVFGMVSPAFAQNRVENHAAGIAVTRPAGWSNATLAQVQANRERTKLSDPEFEAALAARSTLPLIAFTKYAEPHEGLNPSVQITLRQALAGSPTQLLTGALRVMQRAFADLQIVEPVQASQIAGFSGAHVRVTYTLQNRSGMRARVLSRLWLVPRGSLMFLIGMSGAEREPDVCEEEFATVLNSITIER